MLKIYSYSSCSSCRRAVRWLDENAIEFELIDILDNPPPKKELIAAAEKLGDRKYLFNTTGRSYREIGASSIKAMSDKKAFELLVNDPKIIKRPFVMDDSGNFLVGFKEETWTKVLLKGI